MDPELEKKFAEEDLKLEEIKRYVRRIDNYFKWTLIIGILFIILPLIGMLFVLPSFFKALSGNAFGF